MNSQSAVADRLHLRGALEGVQNAMRFVVHGQFEL